MIDRPLRWILPQNALDHAYREMAADGGLGREGIALWAGVAEDQQDAKTIRITHVILLRGPGVARDRGYISIAPELLNDVTDALSSIDGAPYLVGQIHGHPPLASTDLSEVDVAYGIRAPYYLSLVAPNFGMADLPRLDECGVHVFEPYGGWRRLDPAEVAAHLVVPGPTSVPIPCLVVGEDRDA